MLVKSAVDGKKITAYRDEQREIFALSPVFTHAYYIVNWTGEEKSWDYPPSEHAILFMEKH